MTNKRPPRNGVKKEKNVNILVVDGNSLFKRGVTGAKNEYNYNGQHIGGIYQFITVLRKLLSDNLYHRVYVFWDGKFSGKLRYDIYKDYKISRGKDYEHGTQPIDESELKQKLTIKRYLEDLFVRQLEDEIIESDDFIAYICNTKKNNEKITICTSDRDLCQLINEDVRIYMCDLKTYVTDKNYNDYFKHSLENAALIKILCGDNSDCIKGVKRLGEDTLLKHFPELKERKVSIEEIVEKARDLQQERLDNKQKPLQILDNIANGTTDGLQGDRLYEINEMLVNLKNPMMTEGGLNRVQQLIEEPLDPTDRSIKNAFMYMKEDGMDMKIHNYTTDYLIPFKKLMEREKKNNDVFKN